MAISASSLTLAQYAIMANDPLVTKFVYSLLETGTVMENWPMVVNPSLKVNGVRWANSLPSTNWRKLNASTVVTSGTPSPFQEQAYILSNAIDTDIKLIQDKNQISDPRGAQVEAYIRSIAYDTNDKFFNNNHGAGNADSFVGIRQRLDDTTTWGTNTACKIDAGGVDLSDAGMTAATANKFIRFIENMLDEIGNSQGDGIVIYMNRDLHRRANQAIRLLGAGGGFDMTQDAFGRRIEMFRNATVQTIGVKGDQSTEIITSTETNAGANGSSTFTSMYAVKYGEGWMNTWQMNPLGVMDIGIRSDEPTIYRVFVDWAVGILQEHTRAVARCFDVKVA